MPCFEGLHPPVNGLTYHDGFLYITEGGHPARILRLPVAGGEPETVLDGLPGPGNYQTNMVAFGPDGKLYFSQGAMSNTGIIGLDAYDLGWLGRLPHEYDLPGLEIELGDVSVETDDPFNPGARVRTGAFAQFGQVRPTGTRLRPRPPVHLGRDALRARRQRAGARGVGAAQRVRLAVPTRRAPDCRRPRLRRPRQPPGRQGPRAAVRGDRGPVVRLAGLHRRRADLRSPVHPEEGEAPEFILANHHELPPPQPALIEVESHAAMCKLDCSPDGRIVAALFGDEVPMTAPSGPKAGRSLAVIDPEGWTFETVAAPGLQRPIDVRFAPDGSIQVVDFGHFEPGRGTMEATAGSGGVWKSSPGAL